MRMVTFAYCRLGCATQKYTSLLYTPRLHGTLHVLSGLLCDHPDEAHKRQRGRDEQGQWRSAELAPYPPRLSEINAFAIANPVEFVRDVEHALLPPPPAAASPAPPPSPPPPSPHVQPASPSAPQSLSTLRGQHKCGRVDPSTKGKPGWVGRACELPDGHDGNCDWEVVTHRCVVVERKTRERWLDPSRLMPGYAVGAETSKRRGAVAKESKDSGLDPKRLLLLLPKSLDCEERAVMLVSEYVGAACVLALAPHDVLAASRADPSTRKGNNQPGYENE